MNMKTTNSRNKASNKNNKPPTKTKAKASRKRPRQNNNTAEAVQEEAQDYFNRLEYKCQKDWNKQIKATKKLEALKLLKRLQQERKKSAEESEKDDNDEKNQNTTNSKVQRLQEQAQAFKALPVQVMVDEALRRLGVRNLNPSLLVVGAAEEQESSSSSDEDDEEEESKTSSSDDDNKSENDENENDAKNDEPTSRMPNQKQRSTKKDTTSTSTTATMTQPTEEQMPLIERVLSHSRLVKLTEEWNTEISNYRKWHAQRLEQVERYQTRGRDEQSNARNKNNKKNKKSPKHGMVDAQEREFLTHGQSVFLQLGASAEDENDNDGAPMEYDSGAEDNYGMMDGMTTNKKKNRPGQRARKAKALAKEQKQQQRYGGYGAGSNNIGTNNPEDSFNWRGRKNHNNGGSRSDERPSGPPSHDKNPRPPSKGASDKPPPAKEEPLHPSWAAHKAQTNNIVQFQGKKITFDDDDNE